MALTVGAVVLRVTDLPRMTAFWSAALDYVPRAEPEDDWVSLRARTGDGVVHLSLDRKRSRYDLPPRVHLDLYADDQAAEVERLIALGAREVVPTRTADTSQGDASEPASVGPVPQRPADADWRLLEDPEGNRFDVVQLSRPDQRPGT